MRNTLRNFRAEDFEESVEKADRAAARNRKAVKEKRTKKSSASSNEDTASVSSNEDSTSNEVPEGTANEVLDWVGDDKDRAQRALDAENSSDEPRVSLVPKLEKIADGDNKDNNSE